LRHIESGHDRAILVPNARDALRDAQMMQVARSLVALFGEERAEALREELV
jgi:hypothetical protein